MKFAANGSEGELVDRSTDSAWDFSVEWHNSNGIGPHYSIEAQPSTTMLHSYHGRVVAGSGRGWVQVTPLDVPQELLALFLLLLPAGFRQP